MYIADYTLMVKMVRSKNKGLKLMSLAAFLFVILLQAPVFSQSMPPDMPHPRFGMCSARLGDKLYLIGGATRRAQNMRGSMQSYEGFIATSRVEAFDPETLTWDTTIAPMNTSRIFACAATVHDSIYVMGGMDSLGHVLSSVEVYDPSTNTWHYTRSMLHARTGAAATAYGDEHILIFGGIGDSSGAEVEAYSTQTQKWVSTYRMVFPRAYHHVVTVGNAIYIFGGIGANIGPFSFIEKYIPTIGSVQIGISLRRSRMLFGIAEISDSIYVISGMGQSLSDNPPTEVLDFHTEGAERDMLTSAVLDTPRVGFVAMAGNDGQIFLFGGISPDYLSGQVPIPSVETLSILTPVEEKPNTTPTNFNLSQNYPNPFNPTTTIEFGVPPPGARISLDVYNMLGEKVKTLVDGYLRGGRHMASFDGGNMPSGTYIYRLQTENGSTYRKMVLIK